MGGAEAGDILVAGGDVGGALNGIIPLSTSTTSTAAAEVYEALTDAFAAVGSLNTAREASSTAVVLPNNKILIAGGSHCAAHNYGPGGHCGATQFKGFQCDALNTAEIYDESTMAFTTATMTSARSGATANLIAGSGTSLDGKVLITGGSSGSTFLALSPPPPGCGPFGQVAQNTAEIYDPMTNSFSSTGSIPGCTAGESALTTPACTSGLPAVCGTTATAITAATESGTTVTITSAVTGIIVGDNVTITGITPNGYNGIYAVTGTGTGTFTYTDVSGLTSPGTVTNGFASADTAQCGLVDSSAQLLNSGKVLVTGGDYIVFLGQSSPQAFLFNPSSATFSQTAPMNVARELPGIVKLPSGDVLVAGGLTGEAAMCAGTPSTAAAFTTNSSAEIFNGSTWTLTSGSSATPGAPGGMNAKRIAAGELFTSGSNNGLVIFAGGIDAETTDGTNPNFPTCEGVTNIHQSTTTATDLYHPTSTQFTASGTLNQSRGGYGFGILNSGPNSGDFVAIGGECAVGTLGSAAVGTSTAKTLCGVNAQADYYELFNGASWSVGMAATPATPANAPDSALLP